VKGPDKEPQALLEKILGLLEQLTPTPAGRDLYMRLKKGLALTDKYTSHVRRAYVSYLYAQLRQYLTINQDDAAAHIVAKYLKRRLNPRSLESDISKVQQAPLSSRVEKKTNHNSNADLLEEHIASTLWQLTSTSFPVDGDLKMENGGSLNLAEHRRKLLASEEKAANHLQQFAARNNELMLSLRTIYYSIISAANEYQVNDLKDSLLSVLEEAIDWHEGLSLQLKENKSALHKLQQDKLKLHEEIIKTRQLTLVDEYTGLPNRLAFLKYLGAELGRSRRHKYPLSVCVLAVDKKDAVSDIGVRDQLLKFYAQDVISKFRQHDMVARTGQAEFAMYLPNTDVDGAIRALTEAQRRASARQYEIGGINYELPSFSCGIALARTEETAHGLLKRAGEALKQANQDGRQIMEISERNDPFFALPGDSPYQIH